MTSFRILFVCMGNICRSPTGECLFQDYVERSGDAAWIDIDSAGTIDYHTGKSPDSRMQAAGQRRGYTIAGSARQVRPEDFERFDLIIGMDRDNMANLEQVRQQASQVKAELRSFCSFCPDTETQDVPDPYYGGPEGFETVLDLIEAGCPQILEHARTGRVDS